MTAAQQANAERLAKLAVKRAAEARRLKEDAMVQRLDAVQLTEDEQRQVAYITEQLAANDHDYEGREQLLSERREDIVSRAERRATRATQAAERALDFVPNEVPAVMDEREHVPNPACEAVGKCDCTTCKTVLNVTTGVRVPVAAVPRTFDAAAQGI